MKRFLATNIAVLLSLATAFACGPEVTHNYYLFSVFPREMLNSIYEERLNEQWRQYVGTADTDFAYRWNKDDIMDKAKKSGDREMMAYLDHLNNYLDISESMQNSWDYPTKEVLAERNSRIQQLLTAAKSYRGKKLRPQYALLQMRANMLLKRYADNTTFWVATASLLPQSIYRDMMRSIYANALLHTGNKEAAIEIYAEQGDMLSLKWCVRKYRNLAGIRSIYEQNPNSHTLLYLVQDFVNNAQETLDRQSYYADSEFANEEYIADDIKMVGASPVYTAEVKQFIAFANTVVAEGKTDNPSLWKAAVGTLNFFLNNNQQAVKDLDEAITLKGTDRMHDNARAIRIVASTKVNKLDSEYRAWLLGEMTWLDKMIAAERGSLDIYGNHYTELKDRLIYQNLAPKAQSEGQAELSLGLIGMLSEEPLYYETGNPRSPRFKNDDWSWNADYSNLLFSELDKRLAIRVREYYTMLTSKPKDDFYAYVIKANYNDADYYNDLIGTKYLAEGNFSDAEQYLKKVSLSFLNKQNIGGYMAKRDWSRERWFGKQKIKDDNIEGPGHATLSSNPKLLFCQKAKNVESEYFLARGEKRLQLAYELASLYYQASWQGDCWYLTHYGHSCTDTARIGEKDYVTDAVRLLAESSRTTNTDLRAKSLYALAFIPVDPWATVEMTWDDSRNDYITTYHPNPKAKQYRYLYQLNQLLKTKRTAVDAYASRCDVLKAFRRQTRG